MLVVNIIMIAMIYLEAADHLVILVDSLFQEKVMAMMESTVAAGRE